MTPRNKKSAPLPERNWTELLVEIWKKIPTSTLITMGAFIFFAWHFYPSGTASEDVMAAFYAILIIIGVIIILVVLYYVKWDSTFSNLSGLFSRKKSTATSDSAKATVERVVPVRTNFMLAAPKTPTTFLADPTTWMAALFTYVLWGIIKANLLYEATVPWVYSPSGTVYLPLTGIFYAALIVWCAFILMHVKQVYVYLIGVAMGPVLAFLGMFDQWFIPRLTEHSILIPLPDIMKMNVSLNFPADPLIPMQAAFWGMIIVYLLGWVFSKTNAEDCYWKSAALFAAFVLFVPQVINRLI